jgi:hypothetical protein
LGRLPSHPGVAENYEHFVEHGKTMKGRLLQRIENLTPHLYKAIDLVEKELGIDARVSAAQQTYERDEIGAYPLWVVRGTLGVRVGGQRRLI